ncbi:telomere length regulation protein TEL2 homolog [Protopterus annectens]|uniref:telomere length regulation protein TEL2 homolog n=1 Tax=Protopterus annectens TaxID=7888 RepID=UPI001CF9FDFA|nr:telomere length regulation protein TEL2 homolog [Protopterus annectens]
MDSNTSNVWLVLKLAIKTLSSSRDRSEVIDALKTIKRFLGGTENPVPVKEREEFAETHFSRFLQFLAANLNRDWLELLTTDEQKEFLDALFLQGPADQAFLVLLDAIISASHSPSFSLMKCSCILEMFLRHGRMIELLWEVCQKPAKSDLLLWDMLLTKIISVPDHLANKLKQDNKAIFYPQNYFPLLGEAVVKVLQKIWEALRGEKDCSVTFISRLLGKICIQGHGEAVLSVLVPHLATSTQSDFIWQRICWRLVENIPDRWLEGVISGLVQMVPGPEALSQLLGNLASKNKKAHFVLTQKLLLLQYKHKTSVLHNTLGYFAMDHSRRPLLIQVLKDLLGTWGNSSAVKHSPVEQQVYVSKAILISLAHLKDEEVKEHRQALITLVMEGVQCHLDNNIPRIRRLGMIVAECVSSRIDPGGKQLKFQYEEDEETKELLSLLTLPSSQSEKVSSQDSRTVHTSTLPEIDKKEDEQPSAKHQPLKTEGSDSELDSDDDLTPYDMSGDKELKKSKAPAYVIDCIEALVTSEDPDKIEATLTILESMIRKNTAAVKEVSIELAKVLIHLEDKFSIDGFLRLRQRAMVAVTVVDTIDVTQYLTTEFYAVNYSVRQRLDMLDVLVLAAQELSQPASPTGLQTPTDESRTQPCIQLICSTNTDSYTSSKTQHWRKVIEQRIESKTRRFSKGPLRPQPVAMPSRFNSVAGYFFFPLIRNYDRPQATFDLLGNDHFLLGRLVHTLAVLMMFAINTTIAIQMGKVLLDFIWALRYHSDRYVRQSILFCVSSVLLSVPSDCLLVDMSDELIEARSWLTELTEKDPDEDCRSLALQNLVLMENIRKKIEPASLTPL